MLGISVILPHIFVVASCQSHYMITWMLSWRYFLSHKTMQRTIPVLNFSMNTERNHCFVWLWHAKRFPPLIFLKYISREFPQKKLLLSDYKNCWKIFASTWKVSILEMKAEDSFKTHWHKLFAHSHRIFFHAISQKIVLASHFLTLNIKKCMRDSKKVRKSMLIFLDLSRTAQDKVVMTHPVLPVYKKSVKVGLTLNMSPL